jgi:hypothetical protein
MKRFLLALLIPACMPAPTRDPPPQPEGIYTCATACARGAELGCTWAQPTPAGTSCADVCAVASRIAPWNAQCLTTSGTCEAAGTCR